MRFLPLIFNFVLLPHLMGQGATNLVPLNAVTHTAEQDGPWGVASTWGGNLPNDGARVFIPSGVTVEVDGVFNTNLKTVRLEGTLIFSSDVNTELRVETLIGLMGSHLILGSEGDPIAQGVTARLTFIDDGPIDLGDDPDQIGKGAIFMGQVTARGTQKSSFHALASGAFAGSSDVHLEEIPTGWQVGDAVVLTGTDREDPTSEEVRTITALNGSSVSLDAPLSANHVAPRTGLAVHLANLSRNVILSSENPEIDLRGHVMFMNTHQVDMRYVRFYQLGRTNKRIQLDDWIFPNLTADEFEVGNQTNIRGRYSCHFHRGGVDPSAGPPAHIEACVVEDDPGWAFVNHSSHVDFLDNVSYNVVGGAFQTESGDEIGSFVGNLAIRTVNPDFPILDPETEPVDIREITQDFAFQGDGFWFHGGGIAVRDNIASGCSGHGFIYWTEGLREVGTEFDLQNMFKVDNIPNGNLLPGLENVQSWWVPLAEFKGNTAYSVSKGLAAYYVHATLFEDITQLTDSYLATVHSTFEDLTLWNVRKFGVELHNCERFTFRNLDLWNDGGEDAIGILNTITVARESRWEQCNVAGFNIGMVPPTQGDITVCGGTFSNLTDFALIPPQRDSRAPGWDRDIYFDGVEFAVSPLFPADEIVHYELLGGATLAGEVYLAEAEFQSKLFPIPDRIRVTSNALPGMRLYYIEQDADFVPITNENLGDAYGPYAAAVLDQSNEDLMSALGIAFAGALLPENASEHPHVAGGLVSASDPTMAIPSCQFINEPLLEPNAYDDFDFFECWDEANPTSGTTIPTEHVCAANPVPILDEEIKDNDGVVIEIYPNPTDALASVFVDYPGDWKMAVYDINGQIVYEAQSQTSMQSIDTNSLSAGTYIVSVRANRKLVGSYPLIVQ